MAARPAHPLAELSRGRKDVIDDVVRRMAMETADWSAAQAEERVADAIFWEKHRLEDPSTLLRDAADGAFWKDASSRFVAAGAAANTEAIRALIPEIARYHAGEIAGSFSAPVYRLATTAVPRGLSWLLQALSWKSVRRLAAPRVDLRRNVHIQGCGDRLKRLAEKGTIILVPTHFSNLDAILVGWAIHELGLPPFCYGAGLNLFTNPVFRFFMNNLGAYKIDRRKKHALYKDTLRHFSTAILERGAHSLFFPRGGRSRSGGLETKLKLGLLGTAVPAYVGNLLAGREKPRIYIAPCVISYHFVLEAATLISDFLTETGRSRYLIDDDESSKPKVIARFLFKFFRASSSVYLNFGNPMDPFGNPVDDEGESIGPRGKRIDIAGLVRSSGKVCHNAQRDREYTRILGERLLARYRVENIALTSHFVAYTYFELLRERHSPSDLYRLFRFSEPDTAVSFADWARFSQPVLDRLHALHRAGDIQLEPALRSADLRNILEAAHRNLGVYHTSRPLKVSGEGDGRELRCEDMKLLFYYHNRMEGYHLSGRESAA